MMKISWKQTLEKILKEKIKPMMIENGWLYMGYHSGAFYGFDCIKPYHCCMRHIKTRPFWKDMPGYKNNKNSYLRTRHSWEKKYSSSLWWKRFYISRQ